MNQEEFDCLLIFTLTKKQNGQVRLQRFALQTNHTRHERRSMMPCKMYSYFFCLGVGQPWVWFVSLFHVANHSLNNRRMDFYEVFILMNVILKS